MPFRSLRFAAAAALLVRVGSVAVSFVTGVAIARYLGPEGKGLVSFLSTASNLAARGAVAGMDMAFARAHAGGGLPAERVAGTVLGASTGLGVLAAVVLMAGMMCVSQEHLPAPRAVMLGYAAAMPLLLLLHVEGYVLFGLRRELRLASVEIPGRLGYLLAVVVGAGVLGASATTVAWLQLVFLGGIALAGLATIASVLQWRLTFDRHLARLLLFDSLGVYQYTVLRYALSHGGQLLSASLLALSDAGIYSIAVALAEILFIVVGALNMAFYPAVVSRTDRVQTTRRAAGMVFVAALALSMALWLAGRVVVARLYGPAFAVSVDVFLVLAPGTVALCSEQILSSFFAARGMPRAVVATVLGGVVTLVVGSVVGARLGGLVGLAAGCSVAQCLTSACVWIHFRRTASGPHAIVSRGNHG